MAIQRTRVQGKPSAKPGGKPLVPGKRAPRPKGTYSGVEGIARGREEQKASKAKQAARENSFRMPFRFYVPVGEEREGIILDAGFGFFRYEHALFNPQTERWDNFVMCRKEIDACPPCDTEKKDSYYGMYLTILDLTPYTDRKGVTHKFSRKLVVAKPMQQTRLLRLFNDHKDRLRGMKIRCIRNNQTDAAIGGQIDFVKFVKEDYLSTKFIRKGVDSKGKQFTEDCSKPFDYAALFPEQSRKELAAIVGDTAPVPGSEEEYEEEFEEDEEFEEEDLMDPEDEEEEPEEEEEDEADDEDPPFDEDEEEEAEEEEEEEPDLEDEEEDPPPPPRRKPKPSAKPVAKKPTAGNRPRVRR